MQALPLDVPDRSDRAACGPVRLHPVAATLAASMVLVAVFVIGVAAAALTGGEAASDDPAAREATAATDRSVAGDATGRSYAFGA